MKKILTVGMTVLAGLSLAACSNDFSSNKKTSNSSSATSSKKVSPSHQKTDSQSASSKSTSTSSLSDPKIIGLLAYEDVFGKQAITDNDGEMYFGTNSDDNSNGNNGAYIIGAGSTVSTISFSVNGDQVTIYKMSDSGASEADAQYSSYTVSLKELENKYYQSSDDQQQVQSSASSLKDANENSDDEDDTTNDDSDDNSDSSDEDTEPDEDDEEQPSDPEDDVVDTEE